MIILTASIKVSFFKVFLLFISLLILLFMFPYTYSRYETFTASEVQSPVAYYVLDTSYTHDNVRLHDLVPSNSPYVFNFSISNNDGERKLETVMEYDLTIKSTTNLPLVYELYMNEDYESPEATPIATEVVEQDEHGTYFRMFETPTEYFNYFYDETNEYTLVIYFPLEYISYSYQNMIESIEITIDSRQVMDSKLTVTEGRVLHLDASSISGLSDQDYVSIWSDLSGKGNDAMQSTPSERPVYRTNQMNGLPVVRYDGGSDLSILDDDSLRINPEITIFAVVNLESRTTGTGSIRTITSKESGHTNRNWWLVQWDNKWAFRQSSMGTSTVESDSDASTEPTMITVSGDGSTMNMFVDGIEQASSVNYSSLATQDSSVGIGRQADTTARNWVGDIAEIIIYETSLLEGERKIVENYLGEKWLGW